MIGIKFCMTKTPDLIFQLYSLFIFLKYIKLLTEKKIK
jgi:hypothetical protein